MIRRQFDAAPLNAIANHPAVRPMMGGEGDLDFTAFLADHRNVALATDDGGMFFEWSGPGIFQIHTMWMPTARGAVARDLINSMLAEMTADGARMFWAQTPLGHRPVRILARLCGFTSEGLGEHPLLGPVEYFVKESA